MRVALRVSCEGRARDAETAVVNRHGALLLAPEAYPEGTILEITNLESGRSASFVVVWTGGPATRRLVRLGVELREGPEDFWGPDYERMASHAEPPSS